jgi:poly-gamma-glutamate synthesis protein (capsule biosynthesis protein)
MTTLTLVGDLAPVGLSRFVIADHGRQTNTALTLANLEVPLCAPGLSPAPKAGPHLRGEPAIAREMAAGFPSLVASLANNHLMDFGAAGLTETQATIRAAGLRTVGAGHDAAEAAAPLIMQLPGLRVGILAATDRWFGLATTGQPGVNPLAPDLPHRIRQLRPEVDLVIASVHGGGEVSPWPSPRWQQTLRALIDAGATLVHAHHPHVPLGWERHGAGWICYGLGNTLVQPALWAGPNVTRRSWRLQFDLENPGQSPAVSEWEIRGSAAAELACLRPVVAAESEEVVALNGPLADAGLLEGLHQEYALRLWEAFYADRVNLADTGYRRGRLAARLGRDLALAVFQPARWRALLRQRGLFHYHLFSAATHAEEIATALGVLHGELPDRRTAGTRALAERWMPAALFAA